MNDVEVREVHQSPKQPIVIEISDDEEHDKPRESHDDSEEEGIPKVKEMKPVIVPSGVVVKVEKDWWKDSEEK